MEPLYRLPCIMHGTSESTGFHAGNPSSTTTSLCRLYRPWNYSAGFHA
jgi:hypothetical protein